MENFNRNTPPHTLGTEGGIVEREVDTLFHKKSTTVYPNLAEFHRIFKKHLPKNFKIKFQ